MKLTGPMLMRPGPGLASIIDIYEQKGGIMARMMPNYVPRPPTPKQAASQNIFMRCKNTMRYISETSPDLVARMQQSPLRGKTWYDSQLSLLLKFAFRAQKRGLLPYDDEYLWRYPIVGRLLWADASVWYFHASDRIPVGPPFETRWYSAMWRSNGPAAPDPFKYIGDYCPKGKRSRPQYDAGFCAPPKGGGWTHVHWLEKSSTLTFNPPLQEGEHIMWAFTGVDGMEDCLTPVPPIFRARWPDIIGG